MWNWKVPLLLLGKQTSSSIGLRRPGEPVVWSNYSHVWEGAYRDDGTDSTSTTWQDLCHGRQSQRGHHAIHCQQVCNCRHHQSCLVTCPVCQNRMCDSVKVMHLQMSGKFISPHVPALHFVTLIFEPRLNSRGTIQVSFYSESTSQGMWLKCV